MTKNNTWFVRAGKSAAYVEDFLDGEYVALGWPGVGEIGRPTKGELRKQYTQAYPSHSKHKAAMSVGQLNRFINEMAVGDAVCTYDPNTRRYYLGQILTGPDARDHELNRTRKVKWTHEVPRDSLSGGARNTLGAIMALFLLDAGVAREMSEKSVPLGSDVEPKPTKEEAVEVVEEETIELAEVSLKAAEFIEDRIARLDWEQLQELVAGILRGMGYRTRVSPKGPDLGVDIFASPDGLGFEDPRILVEVKHRPNQAMGSQEIRAFLGGRQQADRCLYVSTGGFTKDARYEAERSNVPVTLINLPSLRELLLESYDRLDPATINLVPLQRLYWPKAP